MGVPGRDPQRRLDALWRLIDLLVRILIRELGN
ncbi:hypothetical protein H4W79_001183 [Nocardiopsis terrae]|uniref:Uncharacterized protein n=1 Tax=Nocardiopsis terrae TaxID=372655 RepID=A0ABR9HD87_9ACTN|nr:hypothetical protein [Nocardiopsis terrae]